MTKEEILKNRNLIEIYFNQLVNRESLVQESLLNSKTFLDAIDKTKIEVEIINEALNHIDEEIYKIKVKHDEVSNEEKMLLSKIETRNNTLNKNMELISEIEFENYSKNNEVILKKMRNIYGSKILDKVTKNQKTKLMENIVGDHIYKKNKVNEFVKMISKFEEMQGFLYTNINALENGYKKVI